MDVAIARGKAEWGITHHCHPYSVGWQWRNNPFCNFRGSHGALALPRSRILHSSPHIMFNTFKNHSQGSPQYLLDRVFSGVSDSKRTQATGKNMDTSPKSVTVQVAFELVQAGHRYLDVRTLEEFNAGHVEDAINVPYMFKAGEGMVKNTNFIEEVLSNFAKDDKIIVGCQSGRRSLMAAKDLIAVDFTGVTDVGGGYSAWVQSGLPVKT